MSHLLPGNMPHLYPAICLIFTRQYVSFLCEFGRETRQILEVSLIHTLQQKCRAGRTGVANETEVIPRAWVFVITLFEESRTRHNSAIHKRP